MCQVEAKDPDLGRNGVVLYGLQRGNTSAHSSQLTVDASSGAVLVSDSPLVLGKHTLYIEAADQPTNPSERRFSLAVVSVLVEPGQYQAAVYKLSLFSVMHVRFIFL